LTKEIKILNILKVCGYMSQLKNKKIKIMNFLKIKNKMFQLKNRKLKSQIL